MNPIKILLVDDSKSARYALRLQLKHNDVDVDMADSAEAGLERVKVTHPDAVFMDHTMPGMNGLEALELLKANPATNHIPVVMCTSNEEPEYIAEAREKGALDVLAKSNAKASLPGLLEHLRESLASAAPATASQAPQPAAVSQQPPPVPAMSAEAITQLVRREVARAIEVHLEPAVEPIVAGIEKRLGDAQKGNAQAAVEPLMEEFGKRLTTEIQAHAVRSIDERLQAEFNQLQNQVQGLQDRQDEQSLTRVTNEIIPKAITERFESERNGLAQMMQELIDHSLDNIAQEPKFMVRVGELAESAAKNTAEKTARSSAREVSEMLGNQQMESLMESLASSGGSGKGTMYVLAAIAALIGIASSAGVYFALV